MTKTFNFNDVNSNYRNRASTSGSENIQNVLESENLDLKSKLSEEAKLFGLKEISDNEKVLNNALNSITDYAAKSEEINALNKLSMIDAQLDLISTHHDTTSREYNDMLSKAKDEVNNIDFGFLNPAESKAIYDRISQMKRKVDTSIQNNLADGLASNALEYFNGKMYIPENPVKEFNSPQADNAKHTLRKYFGDRKTNLILDAYKQDVLFNQVYKGASQEDIIKTGNSLDINGLDLTRALQEWKSHNTTKSIANLHLSTRVSIDPVDMQLNNPEGYVYTSKMQVSTYQKMIKNKIDIIKYLEDHNESKSTIAYANGILNNYIEKIQSSINTDPKATYYTTNKELLQLDILSGLHSPPVVVANMLNQEYALGISSPFTNEEIKKMQTQDPIYRMATYNNIQKELDDYPVDDSLKYRAQMSFLNTIRKINKHDADAIEFKIFFPNLTSTMISTSLNNTGNTSLSKIDLNKVLTDNTYSRFPQLEKVGKIKAILENTDPAKIPEIVPGKDLVRTYDKNSYFIPRYIADHSIEPIPITMKRIVQMQLGLNNTFDITFKNVPGHITSLQAMHKNGKPYINTNNPKSSIVIINLDKFNDHDKY